MFEDEATHEGAELNDSDAISQIEALLGADELPQEQDDIENEVPAALEVEEEEAEQDDSDDQEEIDAEDEEDEGALPSTFEELQEAIEVDPEYLANLKHKVKIEGEEGEATLSELVKSYQLEGSLNKRSMDLAEEKKTLEQERETFKTQYDQNLSQSMIVMNYLANQLQQEEQGINWGELHAMGDGSYADTKAVFDKRKEELRNLWGHVSQLNKQNLSKQTDQEKAELQDFLAKESSLLLERIPEWSDAETGRKGYSEVGDFVVSKYGISPEEFYGKRDEAGNIIKAGFDHRQVLMARDAMQKNSIDTKTEIAKKKVKKLPKMLKPGKHQSKKAVKREASAQKMAKLRKTGSDADALSLLSDLY